MMSNLSQLQQIEKIKYHHLGLILFSRYSAFSASSFSKISNYILDWDSSKINNITPDYESHLLIGTLFNKSFPVLVTFKEFSKNDAAKFFSNTLKLIEGVCTHQLNSVIQVNHPKILVFIDSMISHEQIDLLKNAAKNLSQDFSNQYFKSDDKLSYEFLT